MPKEIILITIEMIALKKLGKSPDIVFPIRKNKRFSYKGIINPFLLQFL